MIISASRRTDIPAFYSEWFFRRVREGCLMSRNPRNPGQTKRVELAPSAVDGFVFWTKNPMPMLPRLHELRDFMYYFQFTLTPYSCDIEPYLPDKRSELIPAFLALAREIGPERVVWRYDPIIINEKYDTDFHLRAFDDMSRALEGATKRVIISFLDTSYREAKRNLARLAPVELATAQKLALVSRLAQTANARGMEMSACSSADNFEAAGVSKARCVDGALLERLLGRALVCRPHKGQRPLCGCHLSVDIGAYNTCQHGCIYCYANYSAAAIRLNAARHDPASPFLL